MSGDRADAAFDYVLVGGGLQSGLLALAIRHHQPNARVVLIERSSRLGGNHTWSFHPGDVPSSCLGWIGKLTQHRWPEYQIKIDGDRRRIRLSYASIPSVEFAASIEKLFLQASTRRIEQKEALAVVGAGSPQASLVVPRYRPVSEHQRRWLLLKNTEVIQLNESRVVTNQGEVIDGTCVIDCRGPDTGSRFLTRTGYQKFHGFEVVTKKPWPMENPVVMDSLADQRDGFRFIYSLPFTRHRILVEETRFSDTPQLGRTECWKQLREYLNGLGITEFEVVREERGVLPMPYSNEFTPSRTQPLAGGYAGGWFHAATGYSFPMAVAFAEAVASAKPEEAGEAIERLAERHQWQSTFSRFLNRLLYRLVAPKYRKNIFRRFYRVLDEDQISRFYAHRFTRMDAAKIVIGIPPTLLGLRPVQFVRSFLRGDDS